tara:strand:- start:1808 stop:1993 length:186 start_codon:yes stop_codon:yes gene_type:complete
MLIKNTDALSREELKAFIYYLEDKSESSSNKEIKSIMMPELNRRNNDRTPQIKILNKSLSA